GPPQQVVRALPERARGASRRLRRARRHGSAGARPLRRRRSDRRSRRAPGRGLGGQARPARGRTRGGGGGRDPPATPRAALRAAHRAGVRHHRAPAARAVARSGPAHRCRPAHRGHRPAVPRALPRPRRRRGPPGAVRGRDPRHLPHHRSPRPAPGDPGAGGSCLHDPHSAHGGKDPMTTTSEKVTQEDVLAAVGEDAYGWKDDDTAGMNARRGLNEQVVRDISAAKDEPEWMLERRLKALKLFEKKPIPTWGPDISKLNFDEFKYFVRSTEKQATSWDDLPRS